MSSYLKENKFKDICQNLEIQLDNYWKLLDNLPEPSGKFRVVDGQVILLDKDTLDEYNKRKGTSISALDYISEYWDITSEYQVNEIRNCMLCGVTVPADDEKTELDPLNKKQGG